MNNTNIYLYILAMAVVTYLIRVIPLALIRKKITNRFLSSFLYYVPYATLSAMTIPAIFYSTNEAISAIFGFLTALFLAYKNKSLITVACASCAVVYLIELIPLPF